MADILIRNGTIIDGSGRKGFSADVVIEEDKITMIGDSREISATRVIDATDRVVCPGFVDIHTHADLSVYRDDHPDIFEPLIRQGITTFMGGNCGIGLAPVDKSKNLDAQKMYLEGFTSMDFDEVLRWSSADDYLSFLKKKGVALNMGLLCPHGMLRLQTMGQQDAFADADDIKKMASILNQAMEEGTFGLSTGLQYFPGLYSNTEELVELGKNLTRYDGRFCSHIRSYTSNTISKAIDEVVDVARTNDIHAHISHIFSVPWAGALHKSFLNIVRFLAKHHKMSNAMLPDIFVEGEMRKVMKQFNKEQERGTRIGMDVMPTTTGFTILAAFLPPWCLTVSKETMEGRGTDPGVRKRIIEAIEKGIPKWPHNGEDTWSLNLLKLLGYESVRIMATASEKNKHLEGKSLVEIARNQNKHPVDAALDLILEEDGGVLGFFSPADPEDPFTIRSAYPALKHPEVAVVTDTVLMGFGKPSYLFYGCFPKFFGDYVRDKELLDLETAIKKCTSLPAENMGLKKRGLILENYFADIVIFDPKTIGTNADFSNPCVYPSGLDHTIINGTPVWDNGVYDREALAGQVLRRE